MRDGFVKIPVINTEEDYKSSKHTDEEIEMDKLDDGFRHHENIKSELKTYADNNDVRVVKPFILIIAKNIEDAERLKKKIESHEFKNGEYEGKVIIVHSKQSGVEKDENIQRLLAVEDYNEPTEVVIHVDMLKEGWDVNNLYTIIPLRTANSKILVEQSLGRVLRLPYGKRTGNDIIDKLHIVFHDKYSKVVKAANNNKFGLKIEIVDGNNNNKTRSVDNYSAIELELFNRETDFYLGEDKREIVREVLNIIEEFATNISSSDDLKDVKIQDKIVGEIMYRFGHSDEQWELFPEETKRGIEKVVESVCNKLSERTIDIPHLTIKFPVGFDTTKDSVFEDFDTDISIFNDLKSERKRGLLEFDLQANETTHLGYKQNPNDTPIENPEKFLMEKLKAYMEINYPTDKKLLRKLVGQVLTHIESYAENESKFNKILCSNGNDIVESLLEQLKQHIKKTQDIKITYAVDRAFSPLKTYKINEDSNFPVVSFKNPVDGLNDIKSMIFNGFKKCIYEKQKFDSDPEREFSIILENSPNVIKWFKVNNSMAKNIFNLAYSDKSTGKLHYYCPDFVVETNDKKYIIEIKASSDIDSINTQEKKETALKWCKYATEFEKRHDGKDWCYSLIPHDVINKDSSFTYLVERHTCL